MKKGCLIVGVVACSMISCVFADYTLTSAENMAVQKVVQKIQAKPLRVQEAMIHALKKRASSTKDAHKIALYNALDTQLRQKTTSGDLLATSIERKEIIQSILSQNSAQESGSAMVDLSGKITSLQEGVIAFESSAAVDVDIKKIDNPKVRIQGDFSVKTDEISADIAGEMRVVDMVGYFMLKKLAFTPDEENTGASITPFLGVWWKIPLDTEAKKELQVSINTSTEKNENIQKIVMTKNIIPTLLYKGQKDGISSYAGVIDNTVLAKTLVDVMTVQGEKITEQDKQDLAQTLQGVVIQTNFSIDNKRQMSALALTATFKDKKIEDDVVSGSVTLDIQTSPKIVPITAPKNAKDINELLQQGL